MMDVPILIFLTSFTGYIQLQQANCEAMNKCLSAEENLNCTCCRSGYRGQACSDRCQLCLSRYDSGKCTYYCETGYYGEACDTECPIGCARGVYGARHCKEEDGETVCINGCSDGYYGRQCNQTCDSNCLQMKCFQMDGTCLHCNDSHHYGDHCNIACSQGCLSGMCSRSGRCTEGCKSGFYGEECRSVCGNYCAEGRCTTDNYYRFNCTDGCISGYTRTDCLIRCPHPCKECNQHSGGCTSCIANYVKIHGTEDCTENIPVPLVIAVATGFIIVVIVIVIGVILVRRRVKRTRRYNIADHHPNNTAEILELLPGNKIEHREDDSDFVSDSEPDTIYSSDGGTPCNYPEQ